MKDNMYIPIEIISLFLLLWVLSWPEESDKPLYDSEGNPINRNEEDFADKWLKEHGLPKPW